MATKKRTSRPRGREETLRTFEGELDGRGMRIALVVSRFNDLVCRRLLAGAEDCLQRHGVSSDRRTIVRVPGSWEIPLVVRRLAEGGRHDAVVALGALIRGETLHFDVLAHEVARGLGRVALETGVPVGFGVLTTDTVEQAMARAGAKSGNKGWDAALSALEMASLLRRLST
jgi:6,7-dimethyl-8-ribityllumazine synthase